MMGEKEQARRQMASLGVPIVPGSDGILETAEAALADARRMGVDGIAFEIDVDFPARPARRIAG